MSNSYYAVGWILIGFAFLLAVIVYLEDHLFNHYRTQLHRAIDDAEIRFATPEDVVRLRAALDRERQRLAVVGVFAHGGDIDDVPDEYDSDALDAVIKLRSERDLLYAELQLRRIADGAVPATDQERADAAATLIATYQP